MKHTRRTNTDLSREQLVAVVQSTHMASITAWAPFFADASPCSNSLRCNIRHFEGPMAQLGQLWATGSLPMQLTRPHKFMMPLPQHWRTYLKHLHGRHAAHIE